MQDTELLREIRDLLRLIAEPAIAKRDEALRLSLREIVGKSEQRRRAIELMDGTRTQATIKAEAGIDKGMLSRCVTDLRNASLILEEDKHPKLTISIPSGFFDNQED